VELRDNKTLLFQLYRLYLLNTLVLRIKAVEDDPNHPVLTKKGRGALLNPFAANQVMASCGPNGEPLVYEEYSDEEGDGEDGCTAEEEEARKYRGLDRDEIYKHKMDSFIRLLEDILNPAELPEARELDSVFQLKAQVRAYYERKGQLNEGLTETLYAMMKERSSIIKSKRKYFLINNENPVQESTSHEASGKSEHDEVLTASPRQQTAVRKIRNLYFELEQMRLNSEKERIGNYREMVEALIVKATAQKRPY